MITRTDIDNRFRYHAPNAAQREDHELVRGWVGNLAWSLNEILPEGREASLAITKLEEVMFWANAAIARHEPIQVAPEPSDAKRADEEPPPPAHTGRPGCPACIAFLGATRDVR